MNCAATRIASWKSDDAFDFCSASIYRLINRPLATYFGRFDVIKYRYKMGSGDEIRDSRERDRRDKIGIENSNYLQC